MKWVVKLKIHGVEITQDKPQGIWNWSYPEGTVVSGEVLDQNRLSKAFGEFILTLSKKLPKAEIVLGEEIVFFKKLESESEVSRFLEMVPLDAEKMLKKMLVDNDGRVSVWVSNKILVDAITNGIEASGGRVSMVVAESMLANKAALKNGNFLLKERITTAKDNKLMWLVWMVGVAVWLLIGGVILYRYVRAS